MSDRPADRLSELHREEYTGVHRCWPCTIANLLLLGVTCALLWTVRKPLAVGAGLLGGAAIWLRGYLVPYTPRITGSLLEAGPFDHGEPIDPGVGHGPAPAATGGGTEPGGSRDSPGGGTGEDRELESEPERGSLSEPDGETAGEQLLGTLVEAGVLEADEESVEPTEAFQRGWDEEIQTLRGSDDEELAEAALAESAAVESSVVVSRGRTYIVLEPGSGRAIDESWLRRPTAIGQTAAARALSEMGVPEDERTQAAVAMGMFLTECPDCGSEVVERPVGGCCGPPQLGSEGKPKTGLTCPECRVHFHVFD